MDIQSFRGKALVALVAICAVVAPWSSLVVEAAPTKDVEIAADRGRYVRGERVVVRVGNNSAGRVRVDKPIEIVDASTGDTVATYEWSGSHTLGRGEYIEWNWDQWKGHCVDDCAHPDIDPPDLVKPGRYVARVTTSRGSFEDPFSIGEYFTLGFREGDERFPVFSIDPRTIRQLQAEAEAEEKSLIVSGIVSARSSAEMGWTFFMRPGSLVTGEAFAEVCDASPHHVERRLEDWVGQRWCPWSSYVLSMRGGS